MKILIINPPHMSIGSRMPGEHLPPLGLLSVGGPLIDAGHKVKLLDAEFGPLKFPAIINEVIQYNQMQLCWGIRVPLLHSQ
jgi:anaerobic magnesium-protoporphyrin IX monomethyl ester cyclase